MARLATLVLLILIVLLQAKYWAGSGGVHEVEALRARVAAQELENAELERRNALLAAEVEDLREGKSAVEERARSELGMIQPGEVYYRMVETAGSVETKGVATQGTKP